MKFTRLFLIKLSPDEIIDDSAELYRDWYQVPQERRWSNVGDANWGELSEGCIGRDGEKPTLQDKLMVIAHGSKTCVGEGDRPGSSMRSTWCRPSSSGGSTTSD